MQLLVKIGDSGHPSGYKDGDVVDTFSDERISKAMAQTLCNENESLKDVYSKTFRKYLFIRSVSDSVIRRNLVTGEEDRLSSKPNDIGEYIHTSEYVARHPNKMFKIENRDAWYGGTNADPDIEALWVSIHRLTGHDREDHKSWPVTELEKKHFIPMSCCGTGHLSGDTICSKKDEVLGEDGEIVTMRKWHVPYWDLGMDVDTIRNIEVETDFRLPHDESPLIDLTIFEKEV